MVVLRINSSLLHRIVALLFLCQHRFGAHSVVLLWWHNLSIIKKHLSYGYMIAVTLFSSDSCSLLMHKQNIIWIYYHALWPVLFELSLSLFICTIKRFSCALLVHMMLMLKMKENMSNSFQSKNNMSWTKK